jgi:hypothetical protein
MDDIDEVEMTKIGAGPVVYSMSVNLKGSISAKANGDVSGSIEVSGSC